MGLWLGVVVAASAQAGPPRYTAQIIQHTCAPPFPPSLTTGTGLNNYGQVCGYYWPCDGPINEIGFVWSAETGIVPITPPSGTVVVMPADMNDKGQITGKVRLTSGHERGFLLSDSQWTFIEPICTNGNSSGTALSANGAITGKRWSSLACPSNHWGYVFQQGSIIDIPPRPRGYITAVLDINLLNQVAGGQTTGGITDAFLWSDPDLVELQGLRGSTFDMAFAVTDCSTAVGSSVTSVPNKGSISNAVRWEHGVPIVLPLLPRHVEAFARDINAKQNAIVGYCYDGSSLSADAVLWRDGKVYNLNDLIDGADWHLGSASVINDKGQILCGANDSDGHNVAVLLTPAQGLIGDLNRDGAVGGLDVAILLAAWGACADPCDCPMDLDSNQIVNGFDLAILLGNWS